MAAIEAQISARMSNPLRQPPAWRWFLEHAYTHYPPATLSRLRLSQEIEQLKVIARSMDHTAIAARLKVAVISYHPDKNPSAVRGVRGALIAEEMAKQALTLHHLHRARAKAAPHSNQGHSATL